MTALSFRLVQYFSVVWPYAIFLALVTNVLTVVLLTWGLIVDDWYFSWVPGLLIGVFSIGCRVDGQVTTLRKGHYFSKESYYTGVAVFLSIGMVNVLLYSWYWHGLLLAISVYYPMVLAIIEACFGSEFRQYMSDTTVSIPMSALSFKLVQYFSVVWLYAVFLALVSNVLTVVLLVWGFIAGDWFFSWIPGLPIGLVSIVCRGILQVEPWLKGHSFSEESYYTGVAVFLSIGIVNVFLYSWHGLLVAISVYYPMVLPIIEVCLGNEFRQYMSDTTVLRRADFLVSADAIIQNSSSNDWRDTSRILNSSLSMSRSPSADGPLISPRSKWSISRITRYLGRRPTGPIFLADTPETGTTREASPELVENVLHWSQLLSDWHMDQGLWVTRLDENSYGDTAQIISRSLSGNVTVVDVSQTRSVLWPLIRGLAIASPEYRKALGHREDLDGLRLGARFFHNIPPSSPHEKRKFVINAVLCDQLVRVHKEASGNSKVLPRTTIIVYGVCYQRQADELYESVETMRAYLKNHENSVTIVVVSHPRLHRHVFEKYNVTSSKNFSSLHVFNSGTLYSGKHLNPTAFYENLFLLLEEGIHGIGGHLAERLYEKLKEIEPPTETNSLGLYEGDTVTSTLSIFSTLNDASETRRRLLNCFLMHGSVSQSRINEALIKDNLKIAQVLQTLFEIKSYKKDFPALPREHALAVLNLTHYILDVGLAENQVISDCDIFLKRAHILLNRLADYLRLLPDEIAINGVVLLDEHPAKHGGFSNIYRGMYTNPAGEQVEVALKVLKIFEDQSDERRQILHDKFAKEALVWHYLKHKNIVPFLGVDFTTFPSPARAMVSPWMPEGSILKYMTEHSPAHLYALDLLSDVIDGLSHLHSRNLVHGDLCGRNILMDGNRRARLTDFGLAAFVESDTSIKASTRSGSTRWMAPELLLPAPGAHFKRSPASDVWAFGCVCCEIWSEGDVPFSYIATETGIIFSFADLIESTSEVLPYQSKPRDKGENSMPDALWELVQWCWKLDPSQRPEAQVICAMVSEIAAHSKRLKIGHKEQLEVPVASGSRVSSSPVGSATQSVRPGRSGAAAGKLASSSLFPASLRPILAQERRNIGDGELWPEEQEMRAGGVSRWIPLAYTMREEEMETWVAIFNHSEIARRDGWWFVCCNPGCLTSDIIAALDWSAEVTAQELRSKKMGFLADILDSRESSKLEHLVCLHLSDSHWTVFHHDFTGASAHITRYNPLPTPNTEYGRSTSLNIDDQATLCAYLKDRRPLADDNGQAVTKPRRFLKQYNEEHLGLQRGDSSTCGFWSVFVVFSNLLQFGLNRAVVRDMDHIPAELKEILAPIFVAFRADPVGVRLDLVQQLFKKFDPRLDYSTLNSLHFSVRPNFIERTVENAASVDSWRSD